MKNLGNRINLFKQMRETMLELPDLDYSIISGGFVQNNVKLSDVDILTVLPFIDSSTPSHARNIARKHIHAQLITSHKPDWDFPSDIVTRQQILDAVSGRALCVIKDKLKLKEFTQEEIINNPESDYRIWLYEMITHDFDIICGSFDKLVKDTCLALRTVFIYTVSWKNYSNQIALNKLRTDLFESAGLKYKLSEKQSRYLIDIIESDQMGELMPNGTIRLNPDTMKTATQALKERIRAASKWSGSHICTWKALREEGNFLNSQVNLD